MDLSIWNESAQEFLENKNAQRSIELIQQIGDPSSRVLFNLSRCQEVLDQLLKSKQSLDESLLKDSHCAVGFFQRGVINFKLKNYPEALADFENSQKWVQHGHIDYSQLGMRYKLYLCEVLYNSAVTLIHLNHTPQAHDILNHARSLKSEGRHKVVESLYQKLQDLSISMKYPAIPPKNFESGLNSSGCELIELPVDMIFRPSKYKPKSEKKVDYLGQAKVLSAIDANDQMTGFAGPHRTKPENQPIKTARRQSEPNLSKSSFPVSGDRQIPANHGPPPDRPVPRLPPSNLLPAEASSERPSHSTPHIGAIRMSEEPPERPPPRKTSVSGLVKSMTMSTDENTAPPRPPKRISNPDPASTQTKVKVEFSCNDKQTVLLQRGASLRELKSTACQVFELRPPDFDLWTAEPQKKLSSEADVKQLWSSFQGEKLSLSCYGKK